MRSITKNIGSSPINSSLALPPKDEIKRVLISRPNQRLGNLLLITPLVQEVTATFPKCTIDLFVKGGLAPVLFENYENINLIIELPKKPFKNLIQYFKVWKTIQKQHYDLVINVDQNSSSGRLSTRIARAKYNFFGDLSGDNAIKHEDYVHIAKYPIYNFRSYLTQLGYEKTEHPIPSLDLKLTALEIEEGKKIVADIVKNKKKTFCIFTYATGEKCYSESWWESVYEKLKTAFPDYNIIEVLPVENISMISFKAPTFYSKDVREIGAVIANTHAFIGADSGIMHLASAVHTPTVGLFSVSNINKYKPYNNNSITVDTNISGAENMCIKALNEILRKI
jgi:ADP-heptose:LPS heptosyltransferase